MRTVSAFQVDVTDREQMESFVKDAHAKWSCIDVMLMAPFIPTAGRNGTSAST